MKQISEMFLAIALGGKRVWFASELARCLYDMPLDWVAWADWSPEEWAWPDEEPEAHE